MNRNLLAIISGVVILIVVTFAILLSGEEPDYLPDDTPDGVAHNYLLALHKEEYEIAYAYLSSNLISPPENELEFKRSIEDYWGRFSQNNATTLSIDSSEVRENLAYVDVLETNFNQDGFFGSSQYTYTFELILTLEDGEWKISDGDSYFDWCWTDEEGCR